MLVRSWTAPGRRSAATTPAGRSRRRRRPPRGRLPQQHVGEAARRRSRVQAAPARDDRPVVGERRERAGELVAAAGDVVHGRGSRATTIATSVVTPVAGLVAAAPDTVTRPAAISSLACSRERARPRRTSSWSSRRRRGGTVGSGALAVAGRVGLGVEGAAQLVVRALEHLRRARPPGASASCSDLGEHLGPPPRRRSTPAGSGHARSMAASLLGAEPSNGSGRRRVGDVRDVPRLVEVAPAGRRGDPPPVGVGARPR